ncbi:hypothetical protein GDO81_011067 [Engystomops pustulosus]|uniref:Uncharacterized protein n=1 Tax=Engystomops pustulosus TaxID=76066 RepID=A0AAV7C4B8_ENGPU|nr:hypothetical protein GDO81_011067 [Engystomops pustulosus]
MAGRVWYYSSEPLYMPRQFPLIMWYDLTTQRSFVVCYLGDIYNGEDYMETYNCVISCNSLCREPEILHIPPPMPLGRKWEVPQNLLIRKVPGGGVWIMRWRMMLPPNVYAYSFF